MASYGLDRDSESDSDSDIQIIEPDPMASFNQNIPRDDPDESPIERALRLFDFNLPEPVVEKPKELPKPDPFWAKLMQVIESVMENPEEAAPQIQFTSDKVSIVVPFIAGKHFIVSITERIAAS